MNKKGFTLVELIAVLAILCILTLIITPMVSGYIYDSNLNADKAVASDMQNSISTWMNLDRTEMRVESYTHLSNTEMIGGVSEVQYYNKYMGTQQLPGTEFTNETDIRKAVLSSMRSILGNSLVVNSDWTIESPKASSLLSYRYYYRTGIVKVVDFTQTEEEDELDGYYITLDRIGYSNIASKGFEKVDETETLSSGINNKDINLYGLNVNSIGITEGTVTIWNLCINEKTTIEVDKLKDSKIFTNGLYYIVGKMGNTVDDVQFLLAITDEVSMCYNFGVYSRCSFEYIQKMKNAMNTNEDKEISEEEIETFINGDASVESKKYVMNLSATEMSLTLVGKTYNIV